MLLGQSLSGKRMGAQKPGFFTKIFLATRRFGKKPGFFGGSACRTKSIILTKNLHKLAPTKRKKFLAGNSTEMISDERFVVCGSFH